MKKLLTVGWIALIIGLCPIHADAFSGMCTDWGDARTIYGSSWNTDLAKVSQDNGMFSPANCATLDYRTFVYGNGANNSYNRVDWCASCPSGYQLTDVFDEGYTVGDVCYTGDDDIDSGLSQQTISRQICEKGCAPCSNCESDTTWSNASLSSTGSAYLRRTIRDCDCGKCVSSYQYTCSAGYYGSPKSSTSGCTKCPSSTNIYVSTGTQSKLLAGTTTVSNSTGGATQITGCYLPAGSNYYDSTGKIKLTRNCNYTK